MSELPGTLALQAPHEQLLSRTLGAIGHDVQAYRRDGRLLYVNQPLLDLWGITLDAAIGRNLQELGYAPALARRLQDQLDQVFASGEKVVGETAFTGFAGLPGHYEYVLAPVLAADGTVDFVVGSSRQITDRHRAAAALVRSEEHLRGLIDGLGPSMFVGLLTPDGVALEVNAALLLQSGLQRADVIGRRFEDMHWWAAAGAELTRLQAALARARNGEASRYDARVAGIHGQPIEIDFSLRPLFDASGAVAYLVPSGAVITERKHAELRSERLNRGYIVVSQINALVARAAGREELFREVCRIAVDAGGFRLAWIGVVDVASNCIRPVAAAGGNIDEKIIGERVLLDDDAPQGHGPSARAVRERIAIVVNDVSTDSRIVDGPGHAASGLQSLVSLPVMLNGDLVAVLGLHADALDYFDADEMTLLRGLANDVAFAVEHIDNAAQLAYLAYYDVLTGLANEHRFLQLADRCLRGAANAGQGVAMVLMDLDRFKIINDSVGQAGGDALLRQIAAWLQAQLADPSLLARVGTDHFALMLPHGAGPDDAARRLESLSNAFHAHFFLIGAQPMRISASFGVATFPRDAGTAGAMLKMAESALKRAKTTNTRHLFYTQAMTASVGHTIGLENRLRLALDHGEFLLHYQAKTRVSSGGMSGAEALLRWNDPASGLVPPLQFIPSLEKTGLIHAVGRWALQQAIDDRARWLAAGLATRIAVNVSSLQLRAPNFVSDLAELLRAHPDAAAGLEIEITESMVMADVEHSLVTLQAVRDMGVHVAIDDFGTGFSSLAYLARLPVDTLKIDRSFITEMTQSPAGMSLVSAMITLAHALDLVVVAEGVEHEDEAKLLRLLRCDEMQGYLFSRPVPADVFESNFLRLE